MPPIASEGVAGATGEATNGNNVKMVQELLAGLQAVDLSMLPASDRDLAEKLLSLKLAQSGDEKVMANGAVRGVDHEEEDEEMTEEELLKKWEIKEVHVTEVDSRDVGTPDAWIARHPALVRLTGRHPFNCEPPLSRLMQYGFITPTSLHYVRNHGAVPQVPVSEGDNWAVEIKGLVKRPQVLTVAQLKAMPARTLPVTLVCAGNRRKEENMIRQTIGFSWGAAAVSTTIWKGVRLCDVLKHCGILPRSKGAYHVCFEGEEQLPGGGGSKYGTSLTREVAMTEAEDVLLAYEQNGKPLEPDHGFPIRMIIPGFIGGRMVKWLRWIEVTEKESNNFYHFNDNRVLPSHVDAEQATAEGWWYKPDYIINQLNINSCITSPAHGEVLPITATSAAEPYTMKGYAYTGGGRKIIRVEVSLDNGATWRLSDITYHENPTKYGRYWCWVFWSLPVDVMELMQAKEVMCRAWDAGQNTQPEHITWNVMGMMNNCWFRIKIHPTRPREGGLGLQFEHPTRPGNESGGWMVKEEVKEEAKPRPISKSMSSPGLSSDKRNITLAEVKKHDKEESPWIVVHGKVYDCTKFLEDHPGGGESILINAGMDATEEFDAIHSSKAKAMLEDYYIGDLRIPEVMTPDSSVRGGVLYKPPSLASIDEVKGAEGLGAAVAEKLVALNPRERIPFKLIEKHVLSHDTRRFRFALQSPKHILGLPVGKHMFLSATIDGKFVMRAYTPTSSDDEVGYFDLVIKVYFRGVVPQFPDGGLMSQHLESLQIGETIDVKGPTGHIHYTGRGNFTVNGKPRSCRRIAMLAGGTGITPMYQVIQAITKDAQDETEVWLIYANRTDKDILLQDDLDVWVKNHSNIHVWHTIESPGPANWPYSTGRMNEEMLRTHLPAGAEDTVAFMCGPPPMIKFACIPNLEKMGYSPDHMLTF